MEIGSIRCPTSHTLPTAMHFEGDEKEKGKFKQFKQLSELATASQQKQGDSRHRMPALRGGDNVINWPCLLVVGGATPFCQECPPSSTKECAFLASGAHLKSQMDFSELCMHGNLYKKAKGIECPLRREWGRNRVNKNNKHILNCRFLNGEISRYWCTSLFIKVYTWRSQVFCLIDPKAAQKIKHKTI